LSRRLRVSGQLIVVSSDGSAFQAEGPATEKARSANLVRVRGMTYELLADTCSMHSFTTDQQHHWSYKQLQMYYGPGKGVRNNCVTTPAYTALYQSRHANNGATTGNKLITS